MAKPITRICTDCSSRLKNRSKTTTRCAECWKSFRKANAIGRATPSCKSCGKRLSIKASATGHCGECVKALPRDLRGPTNKPAWNSGKTIFTSSEHKREHQNAARKARRAMDVDAQFLADRIRTLIRNSLKRRGIKKGTKTAQLLGCSPAEFRTHLESQFVNGMTWQNYGNKDGEWNIDHIRPLASFDLTSIEQQKEAFNYMNCRPMWAKENFSRPRKLSALAITATVTFMYEH